MFLLKETYGDFYEIHGNGACGPEGGSNRFWRNMRMYTYIIDEFVNGRKPELNIALDIKEEPNTDIAYVNIKKLVENNKRSDDNEIANFAKLDKDFLLRQIHLISPKIIVCTGTFGFCKWIFDDIETVSHNLSKTKDMLLLGYYHLSYVLSYEEEYNDIVKIIGKHFN
jgi:uracil-DNA glycosylase